MTEPLRVACLGAGYFSQFHLAAWQRIEDVALVAVADQNLSAAEATGCRAFDNLEEMVQLTTPDILDVILPPAAHADIIRRALALGVGTIICQKPFCTSLEEAREITRLADEAGVTLIVHENFRFMPWYRFVKSVLAEGRVGQLQQVTFRLRPGDGQGPEAYLDRQPYFQKMPRFLVQETAVHWVDTFTYLLGLPVSVYADLRRINPVIAGEDAGYILFEHPNGVRALFDGNRHLDHASDNTRRTMGEALFEGTEGTLSLSGDGSVTFRAFGEQQTEEILLRDTWQGFGGNCVEVLQQHVVDAMLRGGSLENTAADYCEILRIRDAIYRSAETGTKVTL